MIKHIPNFLTILRVLAIPFFIICSITNKPLIALIIFIFASITDYFDGMIARKFNIVSNFGKLMDPLADKFLVLSALILLTISPISYIHWSITLIIAFRELAVTLLREYYHKKNIIISANIWGKIKTTVQMIGIIGALVFYTALQMKELAFIHPFEPNIVLSIQIYFWLTAVLTILSGVNYFKIKELKPKGRAFGKTKESSV